MFDVPGLEERRNAFDQAGDYLILASDHLGKIVGDRPGDLKPHRPCLLYLVTEFDDGEQRFAGNTAPIQADPAECQGFDDGHASAKLGGPDGRDIPTRSGAQNSDVLRHGNESMLLRGEKRFVLRRRHQLVDFAGVREIDDDHPALAIGIAVHHFRVILEIAIDLGDRTADRRINSGRGLRRFDFSDLLSGFDSRPGFGQIDEYDIAQRILGEMTNADGGLCAAHTRPLMFVMVSKIGRNHGLLISM